MQRFLVTAATACLATSFAFTQTTIVLPAGYATQVENTANVFPFSSTTATYAGLRTLFVYDSSNFTGQTVNIPILISGIKIRAEDTATSWTGGTFASATVSMSTAAVDYTGANTTWATNHGPDLTVMHNGPVVLQPGTGNGVGVPGPFHIDIPFTTPFLYDPNAGDLAIDFDNPVPSTNWSGGTRPALAHVNQNGIPLPLARRVYSSTLYPTANNFDTNIMVCELTYVPAVGYATTEAYGNGCYQVAGTSFYENFATATHDLSNSSMSLLYSGSGYVAVGGIATLLPTTAATSLALADNAEVTRTLTTGSIPYGANAQATALTVCSNGFVSVATGNGTGLAPSPSVFLNAPRTGWWCWHDYNPALAGSGQVMWEETANHVYVTWNNVYSAGTTGPGSTFQFQFEKSSGHVHYVWGTSANTGNGHLIGFSEGGASADPGSMDISAALPGSFAVNFYRPGIALAGSARPVIGTSITLNTTVIPAGSPVGGTILGLTEHNPGIDLTSVGMAGCSQYVSNDAVVLFFPTGASMSVPFAVPNDPGLAGVLIKAQSAALSPGANALGAVSSNGLRLKLDLN